MGSQSSKLGPESMVGSKKEHAINFITSNTSGMGSKSGLDTRIRKESEWGSTRDSNLINTSFKWAYGGHQVFVTGTFTGWKDHIPLQKVGNDYFNAIVRLPRGMYYYKFIVDGEWKFSPDDPTAPDEHGNINNIIDTTNIESVNKMMGSSMDVRKVTTTEMKGQATENPFTDEAPLLPTHLMGIYFLNEKEKKIQEEKALEKKFFEMGLEEAKKPEKKHDPKREFIINKNELAPPTHVTLYIKESYWNL